MNMQDVCMHNYESVCIVSCVHGKTWSEMYALPGQPEVSYCSCDAALF